MPVAQRAIIHDMPRILGASMVLWAAVCACYADGGPAGVAVVINADSWASMAVANEYVHLRQIPAANVVYLQDLPDFEQVDIETFREQILKPILGELGKRGLADQIDCIAYSSDIPFRINVSADMKGHKFSNVITPQGSINGLTYLYQHVLRKDPSYLSPRTNLYARRLQVELDATPLGPEHRDAYLEAMALVKKKQWAQAAEILKRLAPGAPRCPELLYGLACALARQGNGDEAMRYLAQAVDAGYLNVGGVRADKDLGNLRERPDFKALVERMKSREFTLQPTRGLRHSDKWGPAGQTGTSSGVSYLLSAMLAVTSGRGNSVREAVEALRRSAAADCTHPAGTVYYMVNSDIRSMTRQWGFEAAARRLRKMGVKAQILPGKVPQSKDDVLGAMLGSPSVNWEKSGSTMLPGAICEHLTSLGGIMLEGGGQTPLTALIRNGAAGASGTVTEPYAVQAKFPDPFIHVHYARGCTLAEAFYQSVTGPYQLLIVGDPLCRPSAKPPQIAVAGVPAGEVLRGRVRLSPKAMKEGAPRVGHYELLVGGRRYATSLPGEDLWLDTRDLPDGHHELRVAAVTGDLIQTRRELMLPVHVDNNGLRLEVSGPPSDTVRLDDTLTLKASMVQAGRILFTHNHRLLGVIEGSSGEIGIDCRILGLGPVRLDVVAMTERPPAGHGAIADPIRLTVTPPEALPALKLEAAPKWRKGLLLTPDGGEPTAVEATRKANWLPKTGVKEGQKFVLEGSFDAPVEDVYQFQLRTDGRAVLSVDGTELAQAEVNKWHLLPVCLARGLHSFSIEGTAGAKRRLDVRFGGPGALSVGAPRFRHFAPANDGDA